MPPDHGKPATASARRRHRRDADDLEADSGPSREVELKRSRGEISCAECRRLKIKCDKQIPCQSCQRRGCAALCPNGSLATGEGTRFVLAATEHLHTKIGKMRDRIRQLEDALGKAQAASTSEQHPLLHEDLISFDKEDDDMQLFDQPKPNAIGDVALDRLGMLSITDDGISHFFGPTGVIESLFANESDSTNNSPSVASTQSGGSGRDSLSPAASLPDPLAHLSRCFPFRPSSSSLSPTSSSPPSFDLVRAHLPTYARAHALCLSYIDKADWLFGIVSRTQLISEMLPAIYAKSAPYPPDDYSSPHDLALFYSALSVGALVECDNPNGPADAEHFQELSRAALNCQNVLEKPTLACIQTLHLQSVYLQMTGQDSTGEPTMETAWSVQSLGSQLAYSIGLHRDSARWNLPEKWVQRRRACFWNLFVADIWHCLSTGRPPVFTREYVDTHYPMDPDTRVNKEGIMEPGYSSWSYRFAAECLSDVARRTLGVDAPSYDTILDLDRKIRDFPIPGKLSTPSTDGQYPQQHRPSPPKDGRSMPEDLQRFVLSHTKEVILLYIHRSFFAQAIVDDPENPLKSAYAPSFLSACKSSATILKMIKEQYSMQPQLYARFWSMWTFAFTAAIVFGTIVMHGPRSPLAPAASSELEQAYDLFNRASKHSPRAAKALPILTRIREKAQAALAASKLDPNSGSAKGAAWTTTSGLDEIDEVAIFAGKTRVLAPRRIGTVPSVLLEATSVSSMRAYPPPPPHPHDPYSHHHHHHEPYTATHSESAYQGEFNGAHASNMRSSLSEPPPTPSSVVSTSSDGWMGPDQRLPSLSSAVGPSSYPHHPTPQHHHLHLQHPQHQHQPTTPNGREQQYYITPPSYDQNQHYAPPSTRVPHYDQNGYSTPVPHEPLGVVAPDPYHALDPRNPQAQIQSSTPDVPAYPNIPQNYSPPHELANLGLASRESRLDERWMAFMHNSGYF
ncbi:hypothetical protein PUNSTDRAFT_96824 [Punctularia strigosozonata HHB-11173 SS5]|uniref:uncharacterized protein n=1 Tax=Punctularia strigosozonata (strain HHB-11173) TaxID=741275 RepID=UPI00044163FF|nr:uncharacterized protein PUNSTDRAFT_96824 [Punctularia strigosozonata HHB-11173 SS5]EIN12123.1 hypothetical protein PUNSTDRAFT_96824 [Punctularia strigosozonata HHB-11173 SS5]